MAIEPDGMNTLYLKKLAHGAINCLTNIFNLIWTDAWNMAQSDNHHNPMIRQGQQHRQELAPN